MIASGRIDIGKRRKQNEDQIFISTQPVALLPNLYMVADGMGGYNGGQLASTLAIDSFCDYVKTHESLKLDTEEELIFFLKRGVAHANYTIYQRSMEDRLFQGMGTTLTLCTLMGEYLYIAHVGDTRLYVLKENQVFQITTDHSYVQELVNEGHISQEEAQEHPKRHAITRAVGTYDRVKVDTYKYSLQGVEKVILCSDGLTTMLSDEQISQIVSENKAVQETVDSLVYSANQAGGYDNIAVIILKQSEVRKEC